MFHDPKSTKYWQEWLKKTIQTPIVQQDRTIRKIVRRLIRPKPVVILPNHDA
jgi:hypothetical protein